VDLQGLEQVTIHVEQLHLGPAGALRQTLIEDAQLPQRAHRRPHQGDPRTERAPHRLPLDQLDVDALALERDRGGRA
jgi:hypothetical protein